jgi:Putative metal-binding motif
MAGRKRLLAGLCAAAALAPAAAAEAQAPVPCSAIGNGRYQCYWYVPGDGRTGGSLVVRDRTTVGYLHQGYNWIVCQQQGGDVSKGVYRNHWFGWTLADYNGQWGWASALEARGGANYGPFAGVPNCNGAHGNPPMWSGVWGQPPPPSPPPPPPPAPPRPVDRDRDGVLTPLDCDDRNPRRRPGANDLPGNGIDENCDGADTPLPPGAPPARITATVANTWVAFRRVTRVVRLLVRDAPPGATVTVRCLVRPCKLRRRAVVVGSDGKASVTRLFRRRRIRVRTVVEVRITYPNTIGKVVRYRLRPRRIPPSRVLCLPPGLAKPVGC